MTNDGTIQNLGPVRKQTAGDYYRIFLNHLIKAYEKGLAWPQRSVGEIGPGFHLGVGLSALLAGADRYYAFDLVPHINFDEELSILDELLEMFRERTPAVNDSGRLVFEFPRDIINDEILIKSLSDDRIDNLKANLKAAGHTSQNTMIFYVTPWEEQYQDFRESCNFIVSQSCLEHIEQIEQAYSIFWELLTPGGIMSHKIDLKHHGYSKKWNGKILWNGHWLYDDLQWSDMVKNYLFSINRLTCSEHLTMILRNNFQILRVEKRFTESILKASDLASKFQGMTNEDLKCSGILVQARKP